MKLMGEQSVVLGKRISSYRQSVGMGVGEFAEMVGVDYTILSKIERGGFVFYKGNVQKICERCGVNLDDLFSATEEDEITQKINCIIKSSNEYKKIFEGMVAAIEGIERMK